MKQFSQGYTVDKQFKIIKFQKQTLWGECYLAENLQNHQLLDLTVISSKSFSNSEKAISLLIETSDLFSGFIHKNIIGTFGGGYLDPQHKYAYITSLHQEGEYLSQLISKRYPLGMSKSATYRVLHHICTMLNDVHSDFYHGFLNPDNILIHLTGRLRVSEFGLLTTTAQYLDFNKINKEQLKFLAPETLQNKQSTEKSDIYSIAVLANYLLSGKYPENNLPVLRKDASILLYRTIERGLNLNPEERFNSPLEFLEELKISLAGKTKEQSVVMIDLLKSFETSEDEAKKYMVQKGRLDYGPYSSQEIREKVIEEEIKPEHIIVTISTGLRKKLLQHPDFSDFAGEYERVKELKRREKAEKATEIKEQRQSRTLKLTIILVVTGLFAIAGTVLLYKSVVKHHGGRKSMGLAMEDDLAVEDSFDKNGKKRKRKHRRRHSRRRRNYGGSNGSGKELKVYSLDTKQLTRSQILSVVNNSVIRRIAAKCIPSKGRIYIRYQISGRSGKVNYVSAKLDGVKNSKIASCSYRILKRLRFPKMDTDISGFGSIHY